LSIEMLVAVLIHRLCIVAENFLASPVSHSGLHLRRSSRLSPIFKNGDSVYKTRKSTMKRYCSVFRTTLHQKRTLGLVILGILGLVGGSSLSVQLPSSSYTATGCSFYNAASGNIATLIGATYGSGMQAIEQINHTLNVNKIFPGQ